MRILPPAIGENVQRQEAQRLRREGIALDRYRLGKSLKESDISKQIRSLLFQVGGLPIKIAGGAYQRPGISDFLVCLEGRFIAIEVKKPGLKMTEKQELFQHEVRAAGGIAFVAYSVDDVVRELGLDVKLYPMFARRAN